MGKVKSAADEAREIFRHKVEVPKLYLDAFHSTQKLEVYLRWILLSFIEKIQIRLKDSEISFNPKVGEYWTNREYLNRIKTYLPIEKNKYFYERVKIAIDKRNDFIHNCFKFKNEKGVGISLDMNAFHLSKSSLEKLRLWLEAFSKAETVILSVLARLLRMK